MRQTMSGCKTNARSIQPFSLQDNTLQDASEHDLQATPPAWVVCQQNCDRTQPSNTASSMGRAQL